MASRESELESWTIAQIADEFGVTHRTVRHYEDLGLLSPERRGLNRVYHRRDRTRLNLILRGKRLGFPLEEIRTIIDLYDAPRGRASQLEYVLSQVDERRVDLEQRRRDLDDALKELDAFEESCRADLTRTAADPGATSAGRACGGSSAARSCHRSSGLDPAAAVRRPTSPTAGR